MIIALLSGNDLKDAWAATIREGDLVEPCTDRVLLAGLLPLRGRIGTLCAGRESIPAERVGLFDSRNPSIDDCRKSIQIFNFQQIHRVESAGFP
jgi:hypothetical protein